MKLYLTYAVLLISFMSNTAMFGSFPRQMILTIDAIPDDDICSGTKSRFTVLLKTTLYTTDSLAGYESKKFMTNFFVTFYCCSFLETGEIRYHDGRYIF